MTNDPRLAESDAAGRVAMDTFRYCCPSCGESGMSERQLLVCPGCSTSLDFHGTLASVAKRLMADKEHPVINDDAIQAEQDLKNARLDRERARQEREYERENPDMGKDPKENDDEQP